VANYDRQTLLHIATLKGRWCAPVMRLTNGARGRLYAFPANAKYKTPSTIAVKLGHTPIAAHLPAEHPPTAIGTPALVAANVGGPAL